MAVTEMASTILIILFIRMSYYYFQFHLASEFSNWFISQLFYWLWPKILQIQLDRFLEYWNNHKIRAQPEKPNMSGLMPRHGFMVPALPAQQCGITVDQAVIEALCNQIPVSHKESMRWVDDEFEVTAREAYITVGELPLNDLLCGWTIFASMAGAIKVASSLT